MHYCLEVTQDITGNSKNRKAFVAYAKENGVEELKKW